MCRTLLAGNRLPGPFSTAVGSSRAWARSRSHVSWSVRIVPHVLQATCRRFHVSGSVHGTVVRIREAETVGQAAAEGRTRRHGDCTRGASARTSWRPSSTHGGGSWRHMTWPSCSLATVGTRTGAESVRDAPHRRRRPGQECLRWLPPMPRPLRHPYSGPLGVLHRPRADALRAANCTPAGTQPRRCDPSSSQGQPGRNLGTRTGEVGGGASTSLKYQRPGVATPR